MTDAVSVCVSMCVCVCLRGCVSSTRDRDTPAGRAAKGYRSENMFVHRLLASLARPSYSLKAAAAAAAAAHGSRDASHAHVTCTLTPGALAPPAHVREPPLKRVTFTLLDVSRGS